VGSFTEEVIDNLDLYSEKDFKLPLRDSNNKQAVFPEIIEIEKKIT